MIRRGIEPNEIVMGIILNAYCLNRDMVKARSFFSDLCNMEISRDSIDYSSGIDSTVGIIVEKYKPSLVLYNTLMNGYGLVGDLQSAANLYHEMIQNSVLPAVTTFNILMSAHVRVNDLKGAMSWYDTMIQSSVEPSLVTFNILIHANAKLLNVKGLNEAFSALLSKGFQPDDATYVPMIQCYSQMDQWPVARNLVEKMNSPGGSLRWGSRDRGTVAHNPINGHNIIIETLWNRGDTEGMKKEMDLIKQKNIPLYTSDNGAIYIQTIYRYFS